MNLLKTLFNSNTRLSFRSTYVLGLVCHVIGSCALTRRLTAYLYKHSNYVTQSISLSNIQTTLLVESGPALRLLKPARTHLRRPRKAGEPASKIAVRFNKSGSDLDAVSNVIGGADRDRTDDPLLAKQVLSQLSYSPTSGTFASWWAWVDSNYRPHPYQGCALTN